MATEIDELIVQIKADTKQLNTQLKHVRGQLDKTFPKGQGGNSPVGRFAGALRGLLAPLAAVATGMAAIGAVKGIATVSMQFEDLKDSLNTVFGSIKAGDQAMQDVLSFAQTTPFQVEDVTKAFISLRSAGIEPTRDMLQTFADTASVSVDQLGVFEALVRVTQRSASGGLGLEELNMIMDRGIDVLGILSDRLDLTKDDIAAFGQSAEGARIIMQALTDGLNEKFGGAMESKMDNLSTKTSNMTIAFKDLLNEIGKGGLIDFLKDTADYFTNIANRITQILKAQRTGVSVEARALMMPGEDEDDAGREERLSRLRAQLLADIRAAGTAAGMASDTAALFAGGSNDLNIVRQGTAALETVEDAATKLQGSLQSLYDISDEAGDAGAQAIIDSFRSGLSRSVTIENTDEYLRIGTEVGNAFTAGFFGSDFKDLEVGLSEGGLLTLTPRAKKAVVDSAGTSGATGGTGGGSGGVDVAGLKEKGRIQLQAAEATKLLEKIADPLDAVRQMITDLDQLSLLEDKDGNLQFTAEQIANIRTHLQGVIDDARSKELEELYGGLQSAVEGTVTPAERLEQKMADLKAIIADGDAEIIGFLFGTTDPDKITEIMERLKIQLADLKDTSDDTAATFSETMAPAIASLSQSFTNDFVNSLMSAGDALDAFRNFAKNIVSQIIATFLQMAIVNQILNSVFSGVKGFTPLPTISFGGGGPDGQASGGAMMRGKPYLVGERGPELFVPSVAGNLKNGNDTRSMMGGGAAIVVNQSLNFSTGVVPTVRAEVQRMLPQISEVTKSSVLEATRRGGNYRKGLLGA